MNLTLFDIPADPHATAKAWVPTARRTDPETSHIAAKRAALSASPNRLLCAGLLIAWGPQNDFELAARSGLKQTSIGKRRGELMQVGYVAPVVGLKRPSDTDCPSQVWAITASGRDWYERETNR